jgi:thiol-disulfide isomerase/thioredoxin
MEPMIPEIINDTSFEELWSSIVKRSEEGHNDITFIYFGASWCSPCHVIKPNAMKFMSNLLKENKAKCYQIDIDKCKAGAGWCNIRAVPALIKIRGKKIMNRWFGETLSLFLSTK